MSCDSYSIGKSTNTQKPATKIKAQIDSEATQTKIFKTMSSTASSNDKVAFTNKYGSQNTICSYTGCYNKIASSGDTNCCSFHSKRCIDCGNYFNEKTMKCMECISKMMNEWDENY